MRRVLCVVALAACLAPDERPGTDGGQTSDAGPGGAVTVTITRPPGGAERHRDYLWLDGRWVARVTFAAQVSPQVDKIEWMAGGLVRGVGLPPDYAYDAIYDEDGSQFLAAVVHDARGAERGRAETTLQILAPTAADRDCPAQLAALGVAYADGPPTLGIAHPITLALPLKGLGFTAEAAAAPRTGLLMDCEMALWLWRLVDVLAAHHVTALTDAGLYNYRCVSGSEQPPCPASGLSLHANGLAFDLAAVTTTDGATATVKDDWIIDAGPTCAAASASAKNQRLHDIVCDLYMDGIFGVVLTPDFSAAQAFVHLDNTVGQMVIK